MFFDSTPDFLYPDFKEAGKYKLSKNLFRRVRVRDSFNAVYATSTQYTIIDGETPDSIAFDKLGGSEWYWTILLLNNITDMNTDWPLDNDELEVLIENKYGDLADKVRHWETPEIKDADGNIILDGGAIIETFADSVDQNKPNYVPQIKSPTGGAVTGLSIVNAGENYTDYEGVTVTNLSGGGDGLTVDVGTTGGKITDLTINNNGVNYKKGDIVRIYGGSATARVTAATPIWTDWFFEYIKSYDPIVTDTVTVNDLVKVTNREYEYQLNDLKRNIYIPLGSILPTMRSELEELLRYDTEYKITKEGYRESEEV